MAGGDGIAVAQQPLVRSVRNKKDLRKVPKKETKARREKQKREHLNDLFLELDRVLETSSMRQNNGKASVLVDATRLLRELVEQVKSLEKENAALLNESHYVTVEKNELQDEKNALESDVEKLQNELYQRKNYGSVDGFQSKDEVAPLAQVSGCHDRVQVAAAPAPPQPTSTTMPMQQLPLHGAVFVFPVTQDFHVNSETGAGASPPEPPSEVKRPHPRYPGPSDNWSMELLSRARNASDGALNNRSNSNNCSSTSNSGSRG